MHRPDPHLIGAGRHTVGQLRLRPPSTRLALLTVLTKVRLVLAIWLIDRRRSRR